MQTRKILAALAYFSIFFMGVILPAVLYLLSNDPFVRRHAKAAFLSHLLPYIFIFFFIGAVFSGNIAGLLLLIVLFGLFSLGLTIWNVYRGVKVLL
jgi:hypothetical protein